MRKTRPTKRLEEDTVADEERQREPDPKPANRFDYSTHPLKDGGMQLAVMVIGTLLIMGLGAVLVLGILLSWSSGSSPQ